MGFIVTKLWFGPSVFSTPHINAHQRHIPVWIQVVKTPGPALFQPFDLRRMCVVARLKQKLRDLDMKIVSGGQTGVDLAALEFARQNGLAYGGWVPKGRTNEAGRIPDYLTGLTETQSENVEERTKCNVVTSDATLIFVDGSASPGTDQTLVFAREAGKPHLVVDLAEGTETCAHRVTSWLKSAPIAVLNVAGPRNSEAPGIGAHVRAVLDQVLDLLRK